MTSHRAATLVILAASPALAQWSVNPAAPLAVADRSGEQVQPKIAPTPDGGCYISWFDNSAGGYDVYLQRLDAAGVEQWSHNGILIADRSVSSTVDYDLAIDTAGNAIIAYNDDTVVAGTQQIQVQKVSPAGALLWGPDGVTVSDGVSSYIPPPHLCPLPGGGVAVGWTLNNVLLFQRLDAAGAPQFATPASASETGHYMSLSDLQPDSAGGFIALWVRGTTTSPITSAKALYTQRYDAAGSPQWNSGSPVIVFNSTSIQNGYFPAFLPDGAGGGVYGWYETGGSRNAFVQHVQADGSFRFPAPVPSTGPAAPATRIRVGAGLAYDAAAGEYYLAWPESAASPQGSYSVMVQKFDAAGSRLWGDSGVTVLPQGVPDNQPSFVQCVTLGGRALVFGFSSRSATTGVVFGAGVDAAGTLLWSNLPCTIDDTKSRLATAASTAGFAILAFGNMPFGSVDILAQAVRPDGALGGPAACYPNCDDSTTPPILNVSDFTCFLNKYGAADPYANCDGSTTPPILNVSDFTCFLNAYSAGCS